MILGKLAPTKEEFKEQFGYGTQKKNRVFLAVYLHLQKGGKLGYFPGIDDPTKSKIDFIEDLIKSTDSRINRSFPMNVAYTRSLLGNRNITSKTVTVHNMGLSENAAFIYYIENSRPTNAKGEPLVAKQRAGKFMRRILKEHRVDEMYGEEFVNYYLEIFTQMWKSIGDLNKYVLKFDRDFKFIYDSYNHESDLGSCMTDKGFEGFYNYYLDAYAASLLSLEGKIVSRCVVYNRVIMEAGNGETEDRILRLAERQYSSRGSNVFSQMLVDKLVAAGHIDGWKRIGADASSSESFILINQGSISDRSLYVELENYDVKEDTTPYMDSFKFYNSDTGLAHNYCRSDTQYTLTYTSGRGNGNNYDDYNDEYVDDDLTEVRIYRSDGTYQEMSVASEYAYDNLGWCDHFETYISDWVYSSVMDDNIPSCMQNSLEEEYKKDNWNFDEVNDEYTEEELSVVYILTDCGYVAKDTAESCLDDYIYHDDGNWYDSLTEELEEQLKCA